jgi:RNA polymerase sigma factor (sigma-70 family)
MTTPSHHDDLRLLVPAAARGDDSAWAEIVARFTRRLTRLVRSHRVPAHLADDVVQMTFIRLYEHLGALRDPQALPGWLETTARRETLKTIKAMLREQPLEVTELEHLPARREADDRLDAEVSGALDAAIERLPVRQRTLLRTLSGEQPPSYEEISARLGIPIGSIGPTRGRALGRLRDDSGLVAAIRAASTDDDGDESHVPYWAGMAA